MYRTIFYYFKKSISISHTLKVQRVDKFPISYRNGFYFKLI